MKISKQSRRDGKTLFNACRVNGVLDEAKVRQVLTEVVARKPRGYVATLHHFHRLVKLEVARRTAVVESAAPLAAAIQESIRGNLATRHGAGLDLSFKVNPAVIGGLKVRVGSDIYDGTVAGRLAALESSF
jgi:F-type H+-transporting ATPase subunit delta